MNIKEAKMLITEMYQKDQESWKDFLDNADLIKANTESIKKIIERYGCIDITRFGNKVSHYAWLLVHHSNHDIAFQDRYLSSMIKCDDVLRRDIAFLTDRILILKSLPQIYGTQFDPRTKNTMYSPYPIDDIKKLDHRRASVSLEPMREYIEYMRRKCSIR